MFSEGVSSLVDAYLPPMFNLLRRTLDRLKAFCLGINDVFKRTSTALHPSNERGLWESHGERDDGQRVGEQDVGSNMESTYGEKDTKKGRRCSSPTTVERKQPAR